MNVDKRDGRPLDWSGQPVYVPPTAWWSVQEVARFVRDHDMVAGVVGGAVWAVEVSTDREGKVGREWQRVGTTFGEAKVWLGYDEGDED